MLSEAMQTAMNDQINREYFSSYLYSAMANWFESGNLPGCAKWMRMQADEERGHAEKFVQFLHDKGARVQLQAIDAPQNEWATPLAAFEEAYKHEQHISAEINKLSSLAIDEQDHASRVFLEWFVTEQVEEEASVDAVVQRVRLVQDAPGGMFLIDQELASRSPESEG